MAVKFLTSLFFISNLSNCRVVRLVQHLLRIYLETVLIRQLTTGSRFQKPLWTADPVQASMEIIPTLSTTRQSLIFCRI